MDVAEIYSPSRIAEVARQCGLRGGVSFDLSVPGADGKVWDFSRAESRAAAERLVREQRP